MSGFGGGFGNPAPAPGFGFGGAPAPAFGSSGFGSPPPAAPAPTGFGNANTSSPFGGGFGAPASAPTTFAAPASFGNAQPQPPFGAAPASSGFGTPGFGAAPSSGFGQPSSGFGSTGFGNSSSNSDNSMFGAPFGQQQPPQQQQGTQMMDVPNPFGGGAPAPSVSFGMSSNVVTGGNAPMNNASGGGMSFAAPASSTFGGNNNNIDNSTSFSSNPFGGSAAPSAPFGAAPASGMTFGSSSSSSQQQQHNRQQSSGSVEMGGSDSPTPMTAFGSTFHSTSDRGMDGSLSPIPEDNTMGDPFGSASGNAAGAPSSAPPPQQDGKADELARLKAKIEAKRKKLADRMKNKDGGNNDDSAAAASAAAGTSSSQQQQRQPKQSQESHRNRRNRGAASPGPEDSSDQKSRAERNAIRFATTTTNTATRSHLPSELRGQQQSGAPSGRPSATASSAIGGGGRPSVTSAVGGEANREDLASAKSLIGTCMYMCPDEELVRRERENDIQLLEMPDPGGVHPPQWGLRNTVVKRFRRSAADYKLDVPEWIRPPDVLEEVCAYLEEWVMERDRQGPDRRFPQNGTPNSLDVYQFIWDRTRMIRKDFILSNYVGTGGMCDARAVRCHERIARWHAMCEHQLSHINDFVVQQSQQNIAELGQTIKTLNHFYDDAMGRAYIEVPDDQGRETRTNFNDFSHGCQSDICQGVNPVDYDGSPLTNTADASALSQRLIGKMTVNSPSRGTAECEMRGLYILLVMNNEGGMEVMRYTAALYRERPEIYNSKPVQLALEIFKAKKANNYVRFFKFLRDPGTPYLFACLMFKHIESMRRIAFRMISKTYGAKRRDTGEPIYDAYPLKKLAEILCFDDLDEARAACKHFNITIKPVQLKPGSDGKSGMAEIIFWKQTDFTEPRDEEKNIPIVLRPKKNLKYIESKLNKATRLGVCRGEVSGAGSSLMQLPSKTSTAVSPDAAPSATRAPTSTAPASQPVHVQPSVPVPAPAAFDDEAAKVEELRRRQKALLEAAAKKKKLEEEAKRNAEKERLEAERIRKEREEEKRWLREEKKRKEMERLAEKRRLKEEEEKRKKEQAVREERERKERAAKEALRRQEEARKKAEAEAARKKAEEEERERQRLEAIRKEKERIEREKREAEERRRREEAERIRKEQEMKRLETLRAQEEERKRREALKRKAQEELEQRVDKARKLLLLRRWREQLPRSFQSSRSTRESLGRMDPTFSVSSPFTENFRAEELVSEGSNSRSMAQSQIVDTRKILNRILSEKDPAALDVASLLMNKLQGDGELLHHMRPTGLRMVETEALKTTILLKVAVVLPEPDGLEEESMYESIHTWLNRRLEYGKVDILEDLASAGAGAQNLEVRVLFVKADSWVGPVVCDAALFVIPPEFCSGDWSCSRKIEGIASAFGCIGPDVPRVAYVLGEQFDSEYRETVNEFLGECLQQTETAEFRTFFPVESSVSALERCLKSALKSLIQTFTDDAPLAVEQVSAVKLASKCITDTLWTASVFDSSERARVALSALLKELDKQSHSIEDSWSSWPAGDFATEQGFVLDYFCKDLHLPVAWAYHGFLDRARRVLKELHEAFQEASVPLAVAKMTANAPAALRRECDQLLENRHYRKCIQVALESGFVADEMLFLPQGAAEEIVEAAIRSATGSVGSDLDALDESDNLNNEVDLTGSEDHPSMMESTPATRENAKQKEADESEATDDAGVFKKAQDIFQISRTISPVPPGAMNTPNTVDSPPGSESPPPGVQSNYKRSYSGMSEGDESDSPFRSPVVSGSSTTPRSLLKRPRNASYRSQDEIESSEFTKKLQALYGGGATVDMDVGDTRLSRLVRDLPLQSDQD
ncbi:SAC3 family protein [Seminavis robusta]|uniref:SAC3 family protein n=1 Tax=Seminavis robusta TaxID=568900 RepID=A0A9N8H8J9_9STRA|nr:SAC3 family protein [Seminavis robusta]|eukprot:Sro219_g090470.1 SAC3 family protein (1850) ;mRNA; r:46880-52718